MKAHVAIDTTTGRRLGVAWTELDAWEMWKRAEKKAGERAALTFVEVSRTPLQMRHAIEQRIVAEKAKRASEEFNREQQRLSEPTAPVPDGYRVRVPHRLSKAGHRRWNADWGHELSQIVAADGWVSIKSGPFGTATAALANRGLILIADPIDGRGPILYCATGRAKGRKIA